MLGLEIAMVALLACGGDTGTSVVELKCAGGCQCGHKANVARTVVRSEGTEVVVTSPDGAVPQVRRIVVPHNASRAFVLQDGKLKALPEAKFRTFPQGTVSVLPDGNAKTHADFKLAVPKNVRVMTLDGGKLKTLRVLPGGTILRDGDDGPVLVPQVKRPSSRAILI